MRSTSTRSTGMTSAVAQFAAGADVDKNVAGIKELTTRAAAAGAELVVFPEASMYAFDVPAAELAEAANTRADDFVTAMMDLAAREHVTMVVGMFSPTADGPPHNRMIVLGPDGRLQACYDKVHLYDAFAWRESDKVTAARTHPDLSELGIVDVGGFRLGLLNCYDLRFPEMARALAERAADVLVVSSAWVAGPHKERHWEILLRARAIENTCYVLGANQPPPNSAGLSMIVDPFGLIAGTCVDDEGLALHRLELTHLQQVREIVPSVSHRRYRVVAGDDNAAAEPGNETSLAPQLREQQPGEGP